MNNLLTYYGLKYSPFRPDVPWEAFTITPTVESFLRRMELGALEGGFALVTGEPGTGKSVVLRLLTERLRALPDVVVGTLEHPQSRTSDFYREMADLFGVTITAHNRWAGFKALRSRWRDHIDQYRSHPILFIDEAQETLNSVLSELRILASKEFDSKQLLSVVFAGDSRLTERFRTPELMPLGSRIRRRLMLESSSREELLATLEHRLAHAGNTTLMTQDLMGALVDHSMGNYRVMMNLADEVLVAGFDKKQPILDEKLFVEFCTPSMELKSVGKKET